MRVGLAYVVGAWVILQIVDFGLDAISAPNWIMQVFILLAAVGFPVVLIVAWVFELTPEGIKRESEIDRTQSASAPTRHRMDRVIIVFLAVAVLLLFGERVFVGPSETEPVGTGVTDAVEMASGKNTIAVLPFVNMSSDKEQEYFSDGITEEILNRLAGIRELQVAARTSVFSFKGQNQDIRKIARQLGVETVLEGSVRRSGDDIRITAQLIRASDGFHLWSEAYDRKLENVFAIQDDIASRIADALQVSMGISGQPKMMPRSVNPEVYDLYLRARAMHRQRGEVLLEAVVLFKQALAIDPEFAPAWAGLSHSYIVIPNYISKKEYQAMGDVLAKSVDAAERALELDSALPTAIHAMANTLFFRLEWAEAERHYRQALELDPDSADIMEDYVSLLTFSGQLEASRKVADRMIELDPYVPVFQNAMVALLEAQGENELKAQAIRTALEINPDLPNLQMVRFDDMLRTGQFAAARAYVKQMGELRFTHADLIEQLDWVENQGKSAKTPDPLYSPSVAFHADRYDVWLATVMESKEEWVEWFISPLLELYSTSAPAEKLHRFRSDPSTKAYLEDLRLPEYWLKVGWPDMCQPIGGSDFICG